MGGKKLKVSSATANCHSRTAPANRDGEVYYCPEKELTKAEAEGQRLTEEENRLRIAAEAQRKAQAEARAQDAEKQRMQAEAEVLRRAAEDAQRLKVLENIRRKAEVEEKQRAEQEQRLSSELQALRKTEGEQFKRIQDWKPMFARLKLKPSNSQACTPRSCACTT